MRAFYPILLVIVFSACNPIENNLLTPLEESNYKQLTANAEMLIFLDNCQQYSSYIHIDTIGFSEKGKAIALAKISNPDSPKPKTNVLFIGQQHGSEPAGKEGLILLIKEIGNGNHSYLLDSINLYIVPNCNPDGGDAYMRRNAMDVDLNRDHLLLNSKEAKLIQKVFWDLKPEFTCDFHEYYAYSKGWAEFGYRRDFDIQLGGLTNINVDATIRDWFYDKTFPYTMKKLQAEGYKFFEYTLGYFPEQERMRHSTVDVNDGRQSMGIAETMSFIVEGKRDLDSVYLLERRAKSQYLTALALAEVAHKNNTEIKKMVANARRHSVNKKKVSIRMEHFKGEKPLYYTLWDIKNEKDSTFVVENFHSKVASTLDVVKPKGYLIPKKDSLLCNWLKRSYFNYSEFSPANVKIIAYKINAVDTVIAEEWESFYPRIERKDISNEITDNAYFFVSTAQFASSKIVTALEPQAMYGLSSYKEFNYLLETPVFPILRVE